MTDQKNGFCIRYRVGETPEKGRGVFAAQAVGEGAFVWRFVRGAYVVYDEAAFMAALADKQDADIIHELTHVFGLADFPGFLIKILDDGALINHADDANVATSFGCVSTIGMPSQNLDPTAVQQALLSDRYALAATRAIAAGEELTNDYSTDIADPPYYTRLCERYGVDEDYLDTP